MNSSHRILNLLAIFVGLGATYAADPLPTWNETAARRTEPFRRSRANACVADIAGGPYGNSE